MVSEVRLRPTAMHKIFNATAVKGMYIAASHDTAACKTYAMKKDTRVMGPWHPVKDQVYEGRDLPKTLLAWQESVKNYVLGPIHDRTILWLYDPRGNHGKSKFAKYMDFYHDTRTMAYSDSKDGMHVIGGDPNKRAYMFDLTRIKPKLFSQNDIYATMEMIKNGHFMDAKYDSKIVIMNVPHVIVMANRMPDTSCLSIDRWSIYQLHMGIPQLIVGKNVLSWKNCRHLPLLPPRNDPVMARDETVLSAETERRITTTTRIQRWYRRILNERKCSGPQSYEEWKQKTSVVFTGDIDKFVTKRVKLS